MRYLWEAFHRLASRRQVAVGMGVVYQAIPYEAVVAYQAARGSMLLRWEVDLLMRLDDAVLPVLRASSGHKADQPKDEHMIPATNVKGLKALFRGMAVRKKAQLERRA